MTIIRLLDINLYGCTIDLSRNADDKRTRHANGVYYVARYIVSIRNKLNLWNPMHLIIFLLIYIVLIIFCVCFKSGCVLCVSILFIDVLVITYVCKIR